MKIVLPGERPMSWNTLYAGQHWSVRKREADRVHLMVRASIDPGWEMFATPVHITITVYFDKRPLDACNIPAKIYIDGLKGWLVQDDSPKYIASVRTVPTIDKDNPRVEIVLEAE